MLPNQNNLTLRAKNNLTEAKHISGDIWEVEYPLGIERCTSKELIITLQRCLEYRVAFYEALLETKRVFQNTEIFSTMHKQEQQYFVRKGYELYREEHQEQLEVMAKERDHYHRLLLKLQKKEPEE
jgi:hypothetical protein